jgi:hypothetical protein
MQLRFLKLFIFSFLIIIIFILIWGLNKGFDIADEGMLVLSYQKSYDCPISITFYDKIIKFYFSWIDLNIINLRIIRLILTIISALVFSHGLSVWLKNNNPAKENSLTFSLIFGFILLGGFVSYGLGEQTLSYNHINSFILQISSGLLLCQLSKCDKKLRFRFLLISFVIGILLSIQLFVKQPTALLFFVMIIAIDLSWHGINKKRKAYLILSMISGIVFGCILYSVFIEDIRTEFQRFLLAKSFFQNNFSIYTNQHYLYSLIIVIYQFGKVLIVSMVLVLFYVFFNKFLNKFKNQKTIYLAIVLLAILTIISLKFVVKQLLFLMPLCLILSYLFISFLTDKKSFSQKVLSSNNVILGLFLLILPYLGGLGTGGPLSKHCTFYVPFWYGLILFLLTLFNTENKIKYFLFYLILIQSTYYIIDSFVFHPYSCRNERYFEKYSVSDICPGENVKVDYESKQFLIKLKQNLELIHYKNSDPIIACWNMPGLIYLMGGTSKAGAGYGQKLYFLNLKLSKENYNNSIILLDSLRQPQEFQMIDEGLKEIGIELKINFTKKAEIWNPYHNRYIHIYSKK